MDRGRCRRFRGPRGGAQQTRTDTSREIGRLCRQLGEVTQKELHHFENLADGFDYE
jgi:hypothetical protein